MNQIKQNDHSHLLIYTLRTHKAVSKYYMLHSYTTGIGYNNNQLIIYWLIFIDLSALIYYEKH